MTTKADLLKQIDDAASQYGAPASTAKSRHEGTSTMAKRTGQMVMGGGSGLTGKDLASLNEDKFKHGKTLLSTGIKKETDS